MTDKTPEAGSDNVWEAMAHAYWTYWRKAEEEIARLKEQIRELTEK